MTGTIVTRTLSDGHKVYDARFRGPDGRQVSKTFNKKKIAARFLTATTTRVHDGSYVGVRPVPVGTALDGWLQSLELRVKEGSLRASTLRSYRAIVKNHVRPAFGTHRTDRLTLKVIEQWRRPLAEQVGVGDLTAKFLDNIRGVLSAFIRWCRHPERAHLVHDPLSALERLRLPKSKKRPHYEPDKVAALITLAAESASQDAMILTLAFYSGLRRGELGALRWTDIDWDGGRLHVRGSLDRRVVTGTKTEDSTRSVDVPRELLDKLAVHQLSYPAVGEGFIFRTADGRPLDWGEWHKKRLVKLLKRAGLRAPGSGLHSMRHSYVSVLAALGVDIKYISEQVGHSTVKLTQDVYRHVLQRQRGETMRKLGAAISSNGNPTELAAAPGNGVDHHGNAPGRSS